MFVHAEQLQQLSTEAMRLESVNPWAAASLWKQCLALLPPDSQQYQALQQRVSALAAGMTPAMPSQPPASGTATVRRVPHQQAPHTDSLNNAVLKTVGSMLISIAVYAYFFQNAWVAAGFVVLMLVHEMGHVVANRYHGIAAGPPIFIPFLGAIINLKQSPPNAKVEAIIGIAGPIAGTIGALICYAYFLLTGNQLALVLSWFGFMLNLFNLLPVPPLDGGRVTAALSPWIWVLGLAGLAWLFITDWQAGHFDWILVLVVIYAFPRIKATLQGKARFGEYYKISKRASWTIGTVYIVLGVILLVLFHQTSAGVHWMMNS